MNLPKVRTENLLEQNLKDETLIYDLITDKAFNLNENSTIVYRACGQNQTFEELRRRHQFTDDFIYLALDELKKNNLLIGEYESPFTGTSRREVIKEVGLATMLSLPFITGIVAPTAANAQSRGSGSPNGVCSPLASSDLNETCDNFMGGGRKTNGCFCQYGPCTSTTSGDACCTAQDGLPIRSGTTFTSDAPFYAIVGSDATTPTCAGSGLKCCNGSQTPSGTCSYTTKTPYDGNDPQFEGLFLVGIICSCSC